MFRTVYLLLAIAFLAASFMHLPAQAQERRLALIIANQDYPESIGELQNTFRDAATMDIALTAAGFEVTTIQDAHAGTPKDGVSMEDAITAFELSINDDEDDEDVVEMFLFEIIGVDDKEDVDGNVIATSSSFVSFEPPTVGVVP